MPGGWSDKIISMGGFKNPKTARQHGSGGLTYEEAFHNQLTPILRSLLR